MLNGRGTKVMSPICKELEGKDHQMEEDGMVVKMSCQRGEEQQVHEVAILDVVKNIAVVNDGVKVYARIVLLSQKFDVSMPNIQVALDIKPEDARHCGRTLRFLAFRKLRPIWELQPQPEELYDVWCQIVLCRSISSC